MPVNPVGRVSIATLEVEAPHIQEADRIFRLRLRDICGASFIPAGHSRHGGLPQERGGPLVARSAAGCRNNS
jgi:hypothetical protein